LDGIDGGTFPWSFEEGIFTAIGTTTEITFGFENGPGWFNIDDVNVVPVPEPETGILCGAALAVLAMCRKRACGRTLTGRLQSLRTGN
jgi:hypothetical protein